MKNILLLTAHTQTIKWNDYGHCDFCDEASKNHIEYANKHGYHFKRDIFQIEDYPDWHLTWIKIHSILKYIQDYDYIAWIDSDAVFVNQDIKLEDFIEEGIDLVISKMAPDLKNNRTWTCTTTGFMILKRSEWVVNTLTDMLQNPGHHRFGNFHEQSKLDEYLIQMMEGREDCSLIANRSMEDIDSAVIVDNVKILPWAYQECDEKENYKYIYHAGGSTPTKLNRIQKALKSNYAMNQDKKFLLVTSFYNNPQEHLELTFRNVLNQTYQNWTLIIGDDFSADPEYRTWLKNEILKLNDPRIMYYDVKEKRELYLYQNFFQHLDYDYYFDLDSDDIIDPNILQTYHNHFEMYPEVMSVYCDSTMTNVEGQLQQYFFVKPPENYLAEFNYRSSTNVNHHWLNRSSYNMYGHARCMRRPTESGMHMVKNTRTSTDTLFTFYNLTRGMHLHIPRRLYTYVRREGSDSGWMSAEEHAEFNTNARYYIDKYSKMEPTGHVPVYDNLYNYTSAISACKWLDDVDEVTLIADISEGDKRKIKTIYHDKHITFNDFQCPNAIVAWNKLSESSISNLLGKLDNFVKVTIYNHYETPETDTETMVDKFYAVHQKVLDQVAGNMFNYGWYYFFRHMVITKE